MKKTLKLKGAANKIVAIIVAVVLVGAVAAGGYAVYSALNSPKKIVQDAVLKTTEKTISEVTELYNGLDAVTFWENYYDDKYHFSFEEQDYAFDVYSDWVNLKSNIQVNFLGYDNELILSEDYLTLKSDFFTDTYGLNYSTIESDARSSELLAMAFSQEEIEELIKYFNEVIKISKMQQETLEAFSQLEMNSINIDTMKNLLESYSEIEVVEDESETPQILVDGELQDAKKYIITIPTETYKNAQLTSVENFFANEENVKSIDKIFDIFSQVTSSEYAEDLYSSPEFEQFKNVKSASDLKQKYITSIEENTIAYEQDSDKKITITICNGQVAEFTYKVLDYDFDLIFGAGEKVLDNFGYVNNLTGENLLYSGGFTDTLYTAEITTSILNDYDELNDYDIDISYDTKGTKDNFTVSINDDELTSTIDTTVENNLRFAFDISQYDENMADELGFDIFELNVEKNNFTEEIFTQDSGFKNILTLTQAEMMKVILEFGMAYENIS